MKAQRRHELKENDLSHALLVARDYLDEHGKQIGLAVVVVGAVVIGTALTVRSKGAAIEDHWQRKEELRFTDVEVGRESLAALKNLIQESKDEQFLLESLIDLGQHSLRLAGDVVVPPDQKLNEEARKAFEQLLERFGDKPFASGVAHLGLATVEENAFTLDRKASRKADADRHLSVIIEDPALDGLPFKRIAMDRRAALDVTFVPVVFVEPEVEELTVPDSGTGPAELVIPAPFQSTLEEGAPVDLLPDADEPVESDSPDTPPGSDPGSQDVDKAESDPPQTP